MKLYDHVKQVLLESPHTRSDDRQLMWKIWRDNGTTGSDIMRLSQFLAGVSPESITRARRKVQENCPWLAATPEVKHLRDEREATKGDFVYGQERML